MKWAGCNYHIDRDNGTATSMHDCEGCRRYVPCTIKRDTETWPWSPSIDSGLAGGMKRLNALEGQS